MYVLQFGLIFKVEVTPSNWSNVPPINSKPKAGRNSNSRVKVQRHKPLDQVASRGNSYNWRVNCNISKE